MDTSKWTEKEWTIFKKARNGALNFARTPFRLIKLNVESSETSGAVDKMNDIYNAVLDLITDPAGVDHVIFRGIYQKDADKIPLPKKGQKFMGRECHEHVARNIVDCWLAVNMDSAVFAFKREK